MALPWGGSELAESAPDQVALLFSAVQGYMDARPRRHQPGLQPFTHAKDDEDAASQSDSGAASFLDVVRPALMAAKHICTAVMKVKCMEASVSAAIGFAIDTGLTSTSGVYHKRIHGSHRYWYHSSHVFAAAYVTCRCDLLGLPWSCGRIRV